MTGPALDGHRQAVPQQGQRSKLGLNGRATPVVTQPLQTGREHSGTWRGTGLVGTERDSR